MDIVRPAYQQVRDILRRGTFPPPCNFVHNIDAEIFTKYKANEDPRSANEVDPRGFRWKRRGNVLRRGTWELETPQRFGYEVTSSSKKATVV